MTKTLFATLGLSVATLFAAEKDLTVHTFRKMQLSNKFWSEGAHFGDFNHDGTMDVVSGPYWWEGPSFEKRHEYYQPAQTFKLKKDDGSTETIEGFEGALGKNNAYSDNFFAFTHDFNKDGWTDILIYGFPGKDASWYENPKGKSNAEGKEYWPRHKVLEVVDNESPTWADLTGDGKPEIICNSEGYFGYASPDWNDPAKPWKFHRITPEGPWQRFTHGLGYGDVNGDGRMDVLEAEGWWEQPLSLEGDPQWKKHNVRFNNGGAQMYVYDVNGDDLNDVITSLAAHGHGLSWFEQQKGEPEPTFKQRLIMGSKPTENRYGLKFSQLHAVDLVDMDGDGLKDIITGKRFWAHGAGGDAEPAAPAVLYWFKLVRTADQGVEFTPYLIDDDSGIGTQVVAGDINGDKLPDVVVGNKKGTFVHIHQAKKVSREEWEKAQPKPYTPEPSAAVPTKTDTVVDNPPAAPGGVLPVGKDGKALNLDFEQGTLKDWTVEGDAFDKQPVAGDVVKKRRADMASNHAGKYWVGTYEFNSDKAEGTLTSAPFKITHPYAGFLVAGGPYPKTRVELVRTDNQEVIYKTSGYDGKVFEKSNDASENLSPVVVDLRPHQDKEIFIRVVDQQGGHWGHINFDDFKFYAAKPQFAAATAPRPALVAEDAPALDAVGFAGLSPAEAAKQMILPKGFSAKLFAGEPDVKQPIAFALDDRGRLWVAEAYTYPRRAPEGEGKDRVLVLEDVDGDGQFDKSTVFLDKLNLVSGLEVGFGGVWIGAAPYLMFVADRNGDDKPDGEPEILLDGWAYQDTHETLNTFAWGPDGWLYGCHGIFTHSKVGKPGSADDQRVKINAGIWRFHPSKREFEVFAEGTSNPWGIDFDDRGQCFIEACVIPHLFHVIQGARYQRQAGQHFNPHTYRDVQTIADHVHYAGSKGPHAANGRSDAAGGGHAHAGLMIYLGDSWPDQYRGQIFMNNIHGQRINVDMPERKGSGFVGKHSSDFANFNDRWSQIINLGYDQDGSMYLIDWYDKNQCHHHDVNGHDRSNGRIFKVVYNDRKRTPVDLQKLSDDELVKLQGHKNDWYVRHARRVLQERGPKPAVHAALDKMLATATEETRQLRALWALHATGGFTEEKGVALLRNSNEFLRGWTIQLLAEGKHVSEGTLQEFARLAEKDPSPVVRLYLASALQRLPVGQRTGVLSGLFAHADDATDHNLPLMYWYAAEPVAGESVKSAAGLLSKAKIPLLREFTTRRMTAGSKGTASVQ